MIHGLLKAGGSGNRAPVVSAATLSGVQQVGETLTLNYTYFDNEGDAEDTTIARFSWYAYPTLTDANNNTNATLITTTTTNQYTLTSAEVGEWIRASVTAHATSGTTPGNTVLSSNSIGAIIPNVASFSYNTNRNGMGAFGIVVLAAETFGVNWGDGSATEIVSVPGLIYQGILHQYNDASTKTVQIYSNPLNISSMVLQSQSIVGNVDTTGLENLNLINVSGNNSVGAVTIDPTTGYKNISLGISSVPSINLQGVKASPASIWFFSNATSATTINTTNAGVDPGGFLEKLLLNGLLNISGPLDLSWAAFGGPIGGEINLNNSRFTSLSMNGASGVVGNLNAAGTSISGTVDLSTVGFANNTTLNFTGLAITDVSLPASNGTIRIFYANGSSLGFVDFSQSKISADCDIRLQDCGKTAAEVNQTLDSLVSAAVLSGATGIINIAGTNAAPDTTSGGVDGQAAVTELVNRGYTVTVTP